MRYTLKRQKHSKKNKKQRKHRKQRCQKTQAGGWSLFRRSKKKKQGNKLNRKSILKTAFNDVIEKKKTRLKEINTEIKKMAEFIAKKEPSYEYYTNKLIKFTEKQERRIDRMGYKKLTTKDELAKANKKIDDAKEATWAQTEDGVARDITNNLIGEYHTKHPQLSYCQNSSSSIHRTRSLY